MNFGSFMFLEQAGRADLLVELHVDRDHGFKSKIELISVLLVECFFKACVHYQASSLLGVLGANNLINNTCLRAGEVILEASSVSSLI